MQDYRSSRGGSDALIDGGGTSHDGEHSIQSAGKWASKMLEHRIRLKDGLNEGDIN